MTNRLVLPLHCYDDAGRLLPPRLLWLGLIWLARGWWVWIASLTVFEDRSLLVSTLYPHPQDFLTALAFGTVPLILLGLVAWRHKVYDQRWAISLIGNGFKLLLMIDLLIHIYILGRSPALSQQTIAVFAVIDFFLLLWALRSKRLRFTLSDWQRPDPQ